LSSNAGFIHVAVFVTMSVTPSYTTNCTSALIAFVCDVCNFTGLLFQMWFKLAV